MPLVVATKMQCNLAVIKHMQQCLYTSCHIAYTLLTHGTLALAKWLLCGRATFRANFKASDPNLCTAVTQMSGALELARP